ncbi:MAG: type II secretion system F family protein [Lachnospiraceae bacterium]|nr:type II secretion system F family protein [Lachnospiraceae bacterium]
MLILHLLILFVFLFLFFISRKEADDTEKHSALLKPFYRLALFFTSLRRHGAADAVPSRLALLNPGESVRDNTRRYYAEKLMLSAVIIFLGNLFGLFFAIKSLGNSGFLESPEIKRPSYGEAERSTVLKAYMDGKPVEGDLNVTVTEQQYTPEEIRAIFSEIETALDQVILGENASLDHVDTDLNLVTSLPAYPVSIEWENDDYTVMDKEGHIEKDFINTEGQLLQLFATLTYFDAHDEYELFARVYPRKRSRAEAVFDTLTGEIERTDAESATEAVMKLPSTLFGKALSYREKHSNTGLTLLLMSVIAGCLIYFGQDRELLKQVAAREREMLLNYPEIVSKMTLLIGAGMTLRGAFEKIARDYEARKSTKKYYAYEEMCIAVHKMKSGLSEMQAYQDFGTRCEISRYNKLGNLLSQNLKKGSSDLLRLLEEEVRDAFEERKSLARRLGEEAGTKLLLPMGLMLLIVMVIVIVPAFLSFSL